MISKFFREQKRYNQSELCTILECDETEILSIIRKLKEYGILKAVKANDAQKDLSDLADEDIEISEVESGGNNFYYVFTFVGVISVAGKVLKCYPKYLLSKEEPVDELKQVLKVIEKYNSKEQIIRMFNESTDGGSFNLLAAMLFLMMDYYENGIYNNSKDIIETNGMGEIIWDKTINETFTLISNNRPYYIDMQTKKRITNDFDYFKRLHECVLTVVSNELIAADLLDIFEITEVELTEEEIDDFGEKDYILYRIENELNSQFNTRKQLVLKVLYTFIERNGSFSDVDCLSLFGTNSFNLVWEDVCKDILDDKLDSPLGNISLPVPLCSEYNKNTKLIDLIEKPFWSVTEQNAGDTLIPDSISISESKFIITDAKYYVPKLEKGQVPKAMPGIESVTKQYLYQLAYKDFITIHQFESVINCFIMPTEEKDTIDKETVTMPMFGTLGLSDIKVRLYPAEKAYNYYLSGNKMTISELLL